MSQSKMSRLLRLLMLFNGSRTYSMKELEERTGMSGSTLYRYLDTFEEAGFLINRRSGRYNLKAEDKNVRSLNKLFHFSEEEAYILYQTLSLLEKSSPIKEKLIHKLHTLYDFRSMAAARQHTRMELISTISAAMEEKKQLELVAYRSSNSDTITNRTVEPFQFLDQRRETPLAPPRPQTIEEHLEEVERWAEGEDLAHTFGYYCGLDAINFPPAEQLSHEDMQQVCEAFRRMICTGLYF